MAVCFFGSWANGMGRKATNERLQPNREAAELVCRFIQTSCETKGKGRCRMNAQVVRIERKRAEAKPRPAKLICVDAKIIADAVVTISEHDCNWGRGMAVRTNGVITVRKKMTTEEIVARVRRAL